MNQIIEDENITNQDELVIENVFPQFAMTEETKIENYIDSDNDGIPDDWEINGYTVENNIFVKWEDNKHKDKGFVKYFSDPYDAYSAGGPYSDAEKVLGKFDGLEEARHPLVAAYPRINVEMEKIILSKNINITDEQGKTTNQEKSNTVGLSTSNSHTDSTTLGISTTVEAHASLLDVGGSVSVTGSFSNESSNTVTTDKSSSASASQSLGESVTKSLSLNQSEVAFLNGNIRYTNIGTMPIYNLKPTLNFVLGLGSEANTISTISAKTNTLAKVVLSNQKYPVVTQNAVSWNTSDDFNSQPIKLNYDQVMQLVEWNPLQIQTTQIEGEYKKYDASGEQYVSESFKWEYVLPDIYRKTALITISFADGQTFERRVAANNFNSTTRKIPNLKIKEAIELAFAGAEIKDKEIHYKDKVLKKENLHIAIDQLTDDIIKKQNNKNFFDVTLTKEMKIMFVEEDQKKDAEIFKQVQEKLKFFNGTDYNHFLDLKNKFTLDTDLGKDGELLKKEIRNYLLKNGIPLKIIEKLEINFPSGWGSDGNPWTFRRDKWDANDYHNWYKTTNVKYNGVTSDNFKLYVRNIFFDKADDVKKILDRVVTTLSFFDGKDEDHRFDLNNVIHLTTNIGENGKLLKEVLKTYLLVVGLFSSSIVDNIDLNYKFTGKTLEEDGFKNNDRNTWFITMTVKYHNDWQNDKEFKIFFKNLRSITDWIGVFLHHLGKGVEDAISNWTKGFGKGIGDQLEKVAEISNAFKMMGQMGL